MTREEIRSYLAEDITESRRRWSNALLRVENARRREERKREFPPSTVVWMPNGPVADMLLLTLDVWCTRYCVTPDFIIGAVLDRFRYMRRVPAGSESVHLGLPMRTLAGAEARVAVEKRVAKEFPNGENIRSKNQSKPGAMPDLTPGTIDDMIAQYNSVVLKEQDRLRKQNTAAPSRPYRRVNA